ncbi:methyltransferase domain-containing protein [Thalassotalea euphylliae]|uniref:Methyltransferase domain-containing protein n=1 Tax=Thalassotalea euphylliae TaxID=1655234 RepID=A0A3E0TXP6_9GAMM|nr:methyltransferase domain-containing protein [Thalassotalea euphylliae]REL29244.1 methyltransferase domain-containing protein [Thalassotalea euphylliae]
MYRISELTNQVGLSRTALLYYEKLGLIKGQRQANGYRLYSALDVEQVKFIQQLQLGGLSLKECKTCLAHQVDKEMLKQRLAKLDEEILQKQQAREMLAAMAGLNAEVNEQSWHQKAIHDTPKAHFNWLLTQGFSEKEAFRMKWLSKNMTQHDQYMADFMHVFDGLERWGPGGESETLHALSLLTSKPKRVLEIGCGKGLATKVLAQHLKAEITAVDNEETALASVKQMLQSQPKVKLKSSVKTLCATMTDLPFEPNSFDMIWAESSAYIMGVENALTAWKPLLTDNGLLVFSDLVLLTNKPSKDVTAHWQKDYPDIQTIETRRKQIAKAGYQLIADFTYQQASWDNYYLPLQQRINELSTGMKGSQALADLSREVEFYLKYQKEYGYQMFAAQFKL